VACTSEVTSVMNGFLVSRAILPQGTRPAGDSYNC